METARSIAVAPSRGPALARALRAESLKLKRTLALWLALLAPLTIALLNLGLFVQRPEQMLNINTEESPWSLLAHMNLQYWALLMMPLFVTLETALLASLEHSGDHWKQLYALPVPRAAIYAAKQFASAGLIALSMVALSLLTLLTGLVLKLLLPGMGFEQAIDWRPLLWDTLLVYVSSWLIIALHTVIALNWRSFAVALGVGIVATVASVLVVNSDLGPYNPWTLPALVNNALWNGKAYGQQLAIGALGGLVVAFIGGWLLVRKDVV